MAAHIPEGFHLRKFFGDQFDVILRHNSERARELIDLVERRRKNQRCDLCGLPMKKPASDPKKFVGAYLCDTCRRELQQR